MTQVSSGFSYSCGLLASGSVSCWRNAARVNGLPGNLQYPPSGVGNLKAPAGTYTQVEARNEQPCAVRTDGRVICWPIGRGGNEPLPPGRYRRIAGFYSAVCGITTTKRLRCSRVVDNIGFPTDIARQVPGGHYTQLAVGAQFGCALAVDGHIECWGRATEPPAGRFRELDAQGAHACAITVSWQLRCWSREGPSDYKDAYLPIPAGSFRHVSVGLGYTCALTLTGDARCWGANNELKQASPPRGRFTAISAGSDHTCAITTAGRLRCWGLSQP